MSIIDSLRESVSRWVDFVADSRWYIRNTAPSYMYNKDGGKHSLPFSFPNFA